MSVGEFLDRGQGVVRFGGAPEGLPWLVSLDTPPSADELLRSGAWALGVENPSAPLAGTPLGPIASQVDDLLRRHRVRCLPQPDGSDVELRVLPRLVRALS